MTDREHILRLTRDALDSFDFPATSLGAVVRQAKRIATLRNDYSASHWLTMETQDLTVESEHRRDVGRLAHAELVALLGKEKAETAWTSQYEQWAYNHSIKDGETGKVLVYGMSASQAESELIQFTAVYDTATVAPNLVTVDAGLADIRAAETRKTLLPAMLRYRQIVERIKASVHDYLIKAEAELLLGQTNASVFERVQKHINEKLQALAPDAYSEFIAAQDRYLDGQPAELSQALGSCRRMIKGVADFVYPPSDEVIVGADGKDRVLNDAVYKNRLTQFIYEKMGKHTKTTVVQETIDSLTSKIAALDALSSKGVHGNVSFSEVETCVVQTYLVSAEILSLADGTSGLLDH